MATPGSIVISEHTRRLSEGYFELQALGAAEIKGMEEPLNIYEVIGAGPLRTRLQIAARQGLTQFVGRHSEMAHASSLRAGQDRSRKRGCIYFLFIKNALTINHNLAPR